MVHGKRACVLALVQENQSKLFEFEKNQEAIFNELAKEMHRVHESLTFEFSPVRDGRREFVISADGIRAAFPAVEALHRAAPQLQNWTFIKYRPRRKTINDLTINGETIRASEVRFLLLKDEHPHKVGILLFLQGYQKAEHTKFAQYGYLFLDEAIGEYDMETFVGAMRIESLEHELYEKSLMLSDLAENFDAYFGRNIN